MGHLVPSRIVSSTHGSELLNRWIDRPFPQRPTHWTFDNLIAGWIDRPFTLRPPLWTSEHLIAGWIDRPDPQRPTHAKTSNSLMGCCPSRNVGSPSWTRTPRHRSRSLFFSSPSPVNLNFSYVFKCPKPAAPPLDGNAADPSSSHLFLLLFRRPLLVTMY